MIHENRKETRYNEIGHVNAAELCPIAAILDNISCNGCKIHYTFPVVVDLEAEYDLKVAPLHFTDSTPLHLLCKPQWVNEVGGSTYIGFQVLYSPDANRLNNFILYLESLEENQLPDID